MELRQRQPRVLAPKHLAFIRRLPCLVPGCRTRSDIHAAHIRYANPMFGKRPTGAGEKPSDQWAVPLCGHHHVFGGREAQHSNGERMWWAGHGVDPVEVALFLWRHTGNEPACTAFIMRL